MSLRIGGIAAIAGASLIVIVIALTGGHTEGSENANTIALLVALAALLVALTGMSAFQARTNPWLVWTALAVTAVGTVAISSRASAIWLAPAQETGETALCPSDWSPWALARQRSGSRRTAHPFCHAREHRPS